MASIKTSLGIVNGASSQLQMVYADIERIISVSERANKTNIITGIGNKIEKVASSYKMAIDNLNNNTKAQDKFNSSMNIGVNSANTLLNKIKQISGIYLGAQGIKSIIGTSDTVANVKARLDIMNDSKQSTEQLEKNVMEVANRTRAKYADTANVIAKLGVTARKSFASNDEILAFTELMNKSFKIGGASASEQANGMYQLTQAMASGRLQGDEFRSIIENAPMLANAIAEYLGVSQGELKKMSSDGKITADIIKNAMFSSASSIEERYKKMPITFFDIYTLISNGAVTTFKPFLIELNNIVNSEKFASMSSGLIASFTVLGSVASTLINILVAGGALIYDNWGLIEPIFWTLAIVMGVYTGELILNNIASGIGIAMATAHAIAISAKTGVTIADIAATEGITVAQWALNSAMFACPITWIIGAIIALIGIFYLVIAVINKLTGQSISATGIIIGAFVFLGACLLNSVIFITNILMVLGNFIGNVFKNPVNAVKVLFADMAEGVIQIIYNMAKTIENIINCIPDVSINITSGLGGFLDTIKAEAETVRAEAKFKKADTVKFLDPKKSFDSGYNFGANLFKSKGSVDMPDMFNKGAGFDFSNFGNNDALKNIGDNTKGTKDNTGKLKDSIDVASEDLKYLRDVAQREVIDRTVLRDVKVKVENSFGDIRQTADVDGIIRKIEDRLDEEIASTAEGV